MAFLVKGRPSVFACLIGLFGCGESSTDTDATASSEACACFDPSTRAVLCEFDVTDCGMYDDSERCVEEEPGPVDNEAFVECVIELLLSDGEGKFGGSHRCGDGQYGGHSQVIVRADGTLLTWGESFSDLSTVISPNVHREAPSIAAIEGCADLETVSARWSCIRGEVFGTDPIAVCVPGESWEDA
jgi:hypothetical protein